MEEQRIAQFIVKEKEIYAGFAQKSKSAKKEGLLRDPVWDKKIGGLGIMVRHGGGIEELLSALKLPMEISLPCFAYDSSTEHSGVCTIEEEMFLFDERQHIQILNDLFDVVNSAVNQASPAQLKDAYVNYGQPIFNQTTVILPGNPTEAYVDLILTIADRCEEKFPGIKAPWGTHITVARFLKQVTPADARIFFNCIGWVRPPGK